MVFFYELESKRWAQILVLSFLARWSWAINATESYKMYYYLTKVLALLMKSELIDVNCSVGLRKEYF